jgi:peptide/nickel transport system substrate-binding protein
MKKNAHKTAGLAFIAGTALLATASAVTPANTLVIQRAGEIESLDPHQAFDKNNTEIINNVYDTLVTFEGNSTKLIPMLATDWKVSSDTKTIQLSLRKNVKFHSGNPVTCSDAEYSLRRLLVTNNPTGTAFNLSEGLLGFGYWDDGQLKSTPFSAISNAISCDANEKLVLKLAQPDPTFLMKLAGSWGSVIDSKTAVAAGEWDGTEATWADWPNKDLNNSSLNKTAMGSGAYQMVSREVTQAIFKVNPSYWGAKGKLENVIVKMVDDESSRRLALKNRDTDIASIGNPTVVLKGMSDVTIHRLPTAGTQAIFFNFNIAKGSKFVGSGKLDGGGIPSNFFADLNIRRGFAAAVNYPRIINEVFAGQAENRTMTVPNEIPGFDPNLKSIGYSLENAKTYFRKAFGGQVWQRGFSFTATIESGSEENQAILSLLKQSLVQINPKFKFNVRTMAQNDLYALLGAGVGTIVTEAISLQIPDAASLLNSFYSSQGAFSPHTRFSDAQIDQGLAALSKTIDPQQRSKLVTQIERRANAQQLLVLLPNPYVTVVSRSNVKGVSDNWNVFRFTPLFWNSLSKN